jgi:hypothetical protein
MTEHGALVLGGLLLLLNASAFVALLVAESARTGRASEGRKRSEAQRTGSLGERPEPAVLDVSLEDLVREVEQRENRARYESPAEAALASEIARWRARASGGRPVPASAAPCRSPADSGGRAA